MNLSATQLRLIELLGDKTLSFGCLFRQHYSEGIERATSSPKGGNFNAITDGGVHHFPHVSQVTEILGHVPTPTDLHRWLSNNLAFIQADGTIENPVGFIQVSKKEGGVIQRIPYDQFKPLIDQSEETLQAIISLIESVGKTR